ncbi:hypothetical protein ACJX0J_037398, partial [Zea mays]
MNVNNISKIHFSIGTYHDSAYFNSNTCDTNGHFLPITCASNELKLLFSLNTLGYIKFDILSLALISHGYVNIHTILLEDIIVKENICINTPLQPHVRLGI